jgi:hypothetical protein
MITRTTGESRSKVTMLNEVGMLRDAELEKVAGGDGPQLANVDLQNALQKAQQTLQMMGNISKMFHDNALSVIRRF